MSVRVSPELFLGKLQILAPSGELLFEARESQYAQLLLGAAFVIQPIQLAPNQSLKWEIPVSDFVVFQSSLVSEDESELPYAYSTLTLEQVQGNQLVSELMLQIVDQSTGAEKSKTITLRTSPLIIPKSSS